ncbi:unnamed protein product, partial [Sphagnum troendelagicum]
MAEDNRERMIKALDTMLLELQVPRQIVSPILRKLLQTYENEWDHIEADGYRVLADAIFQHQEQMEVAKEENSNKLNSDSKRKLLNPSETVVVLKKPKLESVVMNELVARPNRKTLCNVFQISRVLPEALQAGKRPADWPSMSVPLYVCLRPPSPTMHMKTGHECRSSLAAIAMDYMDLGDSSSSLSEPLSIASGGCPELQNIVDSTVKEDVCGNSNMGLIDSASIGRDGESKGGVGQDKGMLELVVNIGPKRAEQGNESPYELKAALQEPGSQVVQEVPNCLKQMRHMSSEKNSKPPRGQRTRALKDRASSSSTSSGSSQRANRVRQLNPKPQSESKRLVGPQEAEMSDEIDLSRGSEQIPISVEEFARSRLPRDFLYVSRSIVYQNAYIRFSLARIADEDCCKDCSGNCLASCYPCACARQSGGEYAYSLQGTLRKRFMEQEKQRRRAPVSSLSFCQAGQCPNERLKGETNLEPCKGHTQRHFIKECWEKCGCDKSCSNRVVQRGINCKLQVFWTVEGKGWGLRTLEDLPAGAFVCEYAGEILTNLEMDERNCNSTANTKHHFPLQLDADWSSERFLKDEEALCLDGTYFGNVARFINHRCFDNNMLDVPVEIESPDHHYYHVAYFTSREVKANEELTWDYGLDFNDKEHPIEAFKCQCGSPYCRGKETSSRQHAGSSEK